MISMPLNGSRKVRSTGRLIFSKRFEAQSGKDQHAVVKISNLRGGIDDKRIFAITETGHRGDAI